MNGNVDLEVYSCSLARPPQRKMKEDLPRAKASNKCEGKVEGPLTVHSIQQASPSHGWHGDISPRELTGLRKRVQSVHTLWPATPPLEISSKKKPKFAQRFILFEDVPCSIIYSNKKGGEDYLEVQQYRTGLINYSSALQGYTKHPFQTCCRKIANDVETLQMATKHSVGRKERL